MSPGTLRFKFEEVAGTTEHSCQTFALGQSQAQPQQDLARIEQPHRSIIDDGKTVVLKIPPPPAGVEQPQLRDNVAARSVPPWKTKTDGVPGGPVPGRSQSSHPVARGADRGTSCGTDDPKNEIASR